MRQVSRTELNGESCPVPLDVLGALYRSGDIAAIVAGQGSHLNRPSSTPTRAQVPLHAVAGRLGREIHALALRQHPRVAQREGRLFAKSRISLAGGGGRAS